MVYTIHGIDYDVPEQWYWKHFDDEDFEQQILARSFYTIKKPYISIDPIPVSKDDDDN